MTLILTNDLQTTTQGQMTSSYVPLKAIQLLSETFFLRPKIKII